MLICIAREPTVRLRDIAVLVDLTERAVFGIVDDLCDGKILSKTRVGRRNVYALNHGSGYADEVIALSELLYSTV